MKLRILGLISIFAGASFFIIGCPGKNNPTSPPPNPTSTNTLTAIPSATATNSSTNTATSTPSGTNTNTATATLTGTPTQTSTNSATPTSSSTPTDTPSNTPTSTTTNTPTATPTATATTCTNTGYPSNGTVATANAGYYYAQQLLITTTTLYSLSAYVQNNNSSSGPTTFYLGLYDGSTGNLLASGSFTSAYSTTLQLYTVSVTPVTLPSDGFNLVVWLPGTDPTGQEVGVGNAGSSAWDSGTYGGSSLPANYSSFTSLSGGFSYSPGSYAFTFKTCP